MERPRRGGMSDGHLHRSETSLAGYTGKGVWVGQAQRQILQYGGRSVAQGCC